MPSDPSLIPDILVAALEKSGSPPDRAIMIGDTPYDIEAASRAGLATIAFRCGGWDDANLQGAIAIYDDPRQLLERLSESPFYTENLLGGLGQLIIVTEDIGGCNAEGASEGVFWIPRQLYGQAEHPDQEGTTRHHAQTGGRGTWRRTSSPEHSSFRTSLNR